MPHLMMKFLTLRGEIVIAKADQKQVRQCYVESLKVAPYPPTREPSRPHLTTGGSSQVMSVNKGSSIRILIVYKASLGGHDGVFDVDSHDDTVNKGPKPIEELAKLQLESKPGKCTQLNRDLTSHEYRRIVDVLHRNIDLFTW